jgi:cytochrome c peroxidase
MGRRLFFDPSLSASGQLACASCHQPDHAFAPGNALPVQAGGPGMAAEGLRAVPSLRYLSDTPAFSIGPENPAETEAPPPPDRQVRGPLIAKSANTAPARVPQGGFFRDGRADTLQGQVLGPLLNPLEMANASTGQVVLKLQKNGYAGPMQQLFGPTVMNDPRLLLSEALFAIARYETEEPAFHPYDSKYDYYRAGRVSLSAAEARGLKLFDDPKKGNCAACHLDQKTPDGRPPAFTDYQFEALGVPRNMALKANADPAFFDLGICGPERKDVYAQQAQNCGLFKTPTLRNVATRRAFFHNGVLHTLDAVLHFYVERDILPERFYPLDASGKTMKFDDLPTQYRANIDVIDAPLERRPGDQPALGEAEIQDVIAFLHTLTDGYQPAPASR